MDAEIKENCMYMGLSYKIEDEEKIAPLLDQLYAAGCELWMDSEKTEASMKLALEHNGMAVTGVASPLSPSTEMFKDESETLEIIGDLEGNVSETIEWSFDDEGVLHITGSGRMPDYSRTFPDSPWHHLLGSIEVVEIEEGITTIGENSFYGAMGIRRIILPESLTDIRCAAFENCFALKQVVAPREMMMHCNVYTPKKMRKEKILVWVYAFAGTPWAIEQYGEYLVKDGTVQEYLGKETDLVVPDQIEAIADDAFEGRQITSVVVPASIKRIGNRAFSQSTLQEITVLAPNCEFGSWVFFKAYEMKTIHGYEGSTVEAYAKDNQLAFSAIEDGLK